MGLSKKNLLSFSMMIVVIFSLSAFSYKQYEQLNETYTGMIQTDLQGVYETAEFKNNIAMLGIHVRQYALEPNLDNLKLLKGSQDELTLHIENLDALAKTETVKKMIAEIAQHKSEVDEVISKAVTLIQENKSEEALQVIQTDVKKENAELTAVADEILTLVKNRFDSTAVETNEGASTTLIFLATIAILSILLALFIVYQMHRGITKPIIEMLSSAEKIAAGDLTDQDLEVKTKDEIGQLAVAFNKMKASLQDVIRICNDNALDLSAMSKQLTASTNLVADTSTTVASNIEQMSVNANKSANISQETSEAMSQSSQGVQEIVRSSESIYTMVNETNDLATSGGQHMDIAREQMSKISGIHSVTEQISASTSQVANAANELM